MTYSVRQLKQAAYDAGFRGSALVVAVAISLAENGKRDEKARHVNSNGSVDMGAWQINSIHKDLIARIGDPYKLSDNARMAYALYVGRGRSFRDWVTYNNHAYLSHLTTAQKATRSGSGSDGVPLGGGLLPGTQPQSSGEGGGMPDDQEDRSTVWNYLTGQWSPAGSALGIDDQWGAAKKILTVLSDGEFWRRAGLVAAGVLMVIIGIMLMLGSAKSQAAAAVVGSVVKGKTE